MTIPAKAVMAKDVITVAPETTVYETAKRMLAHGVSAVPVVDGENRPLGLVSEGDLMLTHGFKQVPILRDGVLVGILSRADVVRAVVENLEELMDPTG